MNDNVEEISTANIEKSKTKEYMIFGEVTLPNIKNPVRGFLVWFIKIINSHLFFVLNCF